MAQFFGSLLPKSGLRYFRHGESNKADKMYIQKNGNFNSYLDFLAKNIVKYVYTKCIYKKEKTNMKIPNDINELTKAAESDLDTIPFKKTRTKMLTLRVSEGEKIAIKHMAKVNGVDLSSYIRWLVKQDAKAKREINKIKREGGEID